MERFSKKQESIVRSQEALDHGDFGTVYKNSDGTLTKVFDYDMFKCPPDIMIKLKELHLASIYKLYRFYYRANKGKRYIKAYDMGYIEPEDVSILDIKISKLKLNIRKLFEDMETLSKNSIIVSDIRKRNTIINSEGIHLIDCDGFRIDYRFTVDMIRNYNIKRLYELLHEIFFSALDENKERSFENDINDLHMFVSLHELFKNNSYMEAFDKIEGYDTIREYLIRK